ncbi:DUF2189 domain-containing protein [Microbulbifer thermotolerans]|nr:hypothetical protein [Microbulbifer thermotolerans]MCX2780677.1 hypothetical protein [Microbulbifer thermotolerans]MCX2783597.1 hypothetical protein [Microbulbifer thermotolerans]MCX2795808.1 hypothetical protein [Microbulbifer thermotolerans]MCX2801972.1 hypothetical protein [Microbulbifer thermotolerans]MCX2806335.1 hypothetical protein [Microbulbifer thermotolerans]
MSDIYKAPEAQLTEGGESGSYGSLEKGLAGDYSIAIEDTLKEAWNRSKGKKLTIWLALILYFVCYVAITLVASVITGYSAFNFGASANGALTSMFLYQVIVALATAPLIAGLWMVGVKIAREEQTSATEIFSHFDKLLPLAIANILISIFTLVGFFLFVIPGIYLSVAYLLAIPLIADKNMGPWQAMETSRKAITKHWFSFFGFLIVCLLLYFAGALALLIGLIWALPLIAIAIGVVYRNIFGGPED